MEKLARAQAFGQLEGVFRAENIGAHEVAAAVFGKFRQARQMPELVDWTGIDCINRRLIGEVTWKKMNARMEESKRAGTIFQRVSVSGANKTINLA